MFLLIHTQVCILKRSAGMLIRAITENFSTTKPLLLSGKTEKWKLLEQILDVLHL